MFHSMARWLRGSNVCAARKAGVRLLLESLEDRTAPALLGQQLFPADNPWNQPIANAPVAANSAAIMNNIITHYGDGRLHPDFGQDYGTSQDLYGIPYNIVHGNSTPKVSVVIDAYPDESDVFAAPIPAAAVIEGDFQNGPNVGVDNRGDSHLIVWDEDNNIAYEFYRASRPSENADGKWHADQETVWNMNTDTFRTLGFTSADAAGLSLLAGLVRPDEALPVSEGGQGVINHAIRFTLQNSIILDQFIYPASHIANSGNNPATQPPMGARFRLKADVDISQLNPESRVIAQAMKDFGMIVADNGSNFFFSGATSSVDASNQLTLTWNDDDIQDSLHGLKSLLYSDFEAVDLTPVVTGLSVHQGSADTQISIVGQNFAGAAGQLHVYFGNTEAGSVTYVDDGQLLATVPAGTGTVDVRVQSGQSTQSDSQNIKSTIFGYGISLTNANDKFTFGTQTVNAAPTVATPASASPAVLMGATASLSVLGADDGGEANLAYTWSIQSKPVGAVNPTFSVNATNAAKNTTAKFTHTGAYTFLVTIRDAAGLTAVSTASVTVARLKPNGPPTVARAATAYPAVVTKTTTRLSVLGADDGGEANLVYMWSVQSKPAGAADPTFTVNASNAAKVTTATFTQAGVYQFMVTISDVQGLSVTRSVTVTVKPTVTTIRVTPAQTTVAVNQALQLYADALDQFGNLISPSPKFTWSIVGLGTLTQTGLYTAPAKPGGPYVIKATVGTVHGSATVTVVTPATV